MRSLLKLGKTSNARWQSCILWGVPGESVWDWNKCATNDIGCLFSFHLRTLIWSHQPPFRWRKEKDRVHDWVFLSCPDLGDAVIIRCGFTLISCIFLVFHPQKNFGMWGVCTCVLRWVCARHGRVERGDGHLWKREGPYLSNRTQEGHAWSSQILCPT